MAALAAIVLAGLAANRLDSESLTMTTSYPAPAGVYQSLVVTQNATVARDGGSLTVGGASNPNGNINQTGVLTSNGTGNSSFAGSLGIGTTGPVTKLDVAGGIRAGNQTQAAACSAANSGTLRYNSASDLVEYCNKSGSWSPVGGGLAGAPCGLSYAQSTPAATPVIFTGMPVTVPPAGQIKTLAKCLGQDPVTSCPAGFTRFQMAAIAWDTGTASAGSFITCVK